MSELLIIKEFQTNLISFIDELIYIFPEEEELIILRIKLNDQIPIQYTLDTFNHHINKDEQKIKTLIKDNDMLLFETNIFEYFIEDFPLNFKKLSTRIDNDDANTFLKWMNSFLFLIEKYNKLKTEH